MRINDTRTPEELATELARIDAQLTAVNGALNSFESHADHSNISKATGSAWNALHDAVTVLEAERRTVELNAPHADATAVLVHQNID